MEQPDDRSDRPSISLVVLQPTSRCNLNCRYCYVADRENVAVMDRSTVRSAFRAVFTSALVQREVEFLWHAGEPLTAGLGFYERAFADLREIRPAGVQVTHALQTNGTLVTDRWAELFRTNQVQVGVSIDGPAALHDRQRTTWAGRGSHAATVRGIHVLREHGVSVGALCVVTRASLDHPDAIYDELVRLGITSVGFNVEEIEGHHRCSSLGDDDAAAFVRFIERLWLRWRAAPELLEIREFDRTLRVLAQARADPNWVRVPDETVGFRMITINRDGDVTTYSPELAGARRFVLGNVRRESLDDLVSSPTYAAMRAEVDAGIRACRGQCAYFRLCGGGYTSNKYFEHGTLASTATTTCRLHRQRLLDVVLHQLAGETTAARRAVMP